MTTRIGLVGLGQMGLPVCGRLASAFDVLAYDLSAERRGLAAEHARVAVTETLEDLAACETVVLSLPTPAISRQVLEELRPQLPRGAIVIETSTVLPDDARAWQRLLDAQGVRVVDAAVLSGVAQMTRGDATLLVGGEEADVERITPVLEAIGGAGHRVFGSLGSGMAAKVVNNGVAHAVMVVLSEAFAMAGAEGIELADVAEMLERPDGGLMRPLTHRVMERVARGEYEGGMPLDAARKDSTLALAMAQRAGLPLFATQAAQSVYDMALAEGFGRDDYASVAQLWERWGDLSLRFDPRGEH